MKPHRHKRRFSRSGLLLAVLLLLVSTAAGCRLLGSGQDRDALPEAPAGGSFTVQSPALAQGEAVPVEYTCDGEDASPPIEVYGVPDETKSLALVLADPDAPGGTFIHWLIWNIPAATTELPRGLPRNESAAGLDAALQGTNDFGETGYRGPCPPPGPAHTYELHVYALDTMLNVGAGAKLPALEEAMEGRVLGEAVLTAEYGR